MARRASFGRRPRVQQNITGTLVAIAREMQAREDQNIMSAWREGGQVHGKDATDDSVLAYWTKRRKTLDKNDPSYDQIDNQIGQLEYAVAQSKADLLHVQGKMSDSAFAQFYLKWAEKVPKNSEFWRVLQKDAAALMAASKAKRGSGADNSQKIKVENYNKFVEGVSKRDIEFGNALREAVHKISDQTGLTLDGNGDKLLELLSADYKLNPNEYLALRDAAKSRPNWDGQITRQLYSNEMERAVDGSAEIAARSKKDGFVSNWQSNAKAASIYADEGQNIAGWDVGKSYAIRESQFLKDIQSGDIVSQKKATDEFGAWIDAQSKNTKLDAATRQLLAVDAARLLGNTEGVDIAAPGYGGGVLKHGDTIAQIAPQVAKNLELTTARDADPGSFVYAHVDSKTGLYDPTGQGPISIVGRSTVPADAVYLPQATGSGSPITVAASPQNVYARDPNNPTAPPTLVGVVVSQKNGDQVLEHYRIKAEDGSFAWVSRETAMADGVTEERDGDGNRYWTPPAVQLTPDQLIANATAADKTTNGKTKLADLARAQLAAGVAPNAVDIKQEVPRAGGGSDTYTIGGGRVEGKYVEDPGAGQNAPHAPAGDPMAVKTTQNLTLFEDPTARSQYNPFGVVDPSIRQADKEDLPMGLRFNSAAGKALNDLVKNMTGDQARTILNDPEFQYAFINEESRLLNTSPDDPRIADDFRRAQMGANLTQGLPFARERYGRSAAQRIDLNMPGLKGTDAKGQPAITFGSQSLVIPTAPRINPSGDAADRAAEAQKRLQPTAFGTAQAAIAAAGAQFGVAGSPPPPAALTTALPNATPTSTPTAKPTPTPTATPTPTPTPVATPTPTPTPTISNPSPGAYSGPPGSRFG